MFLIGNSNTLLTLKVFPTYQASIDVDVGERDGAKFLKVEIQHAPDGQTSARIRMEKEANFGYLLSYRPLTC